MEEYICKLEEKLMYALGPKNKEFSENTKNNFRKIIRNNIDNDTYTIKNELNKYYKILILIGKEFKLCMYMRKKKEILM